MRSFPSPLPVLATATFAALLVLVFKLGPALYALGISLFDTRLLRGGGEFVFLDNYRRLLEDERFWQSLGISGLYAGSLVLLATASGLGLALALRSPTAWSQVMRVGFVVPAVLPAVVAASIWTWLFDPSFGLINQALALLGITGPAWLRDPAWALPSLIAVGVWRETGLTLVIFLAALARIPRELEAAAALDGASDAQIVRHITFPLLLPAAALVVVTTGLRALEHFTPFFVMTGGGPAGATSSWAFYLYNVGFERYQIGYASAMAVTVGLLLGGLLWLNWRLVRRPWGAGA